MLSLIGDVLCFMKIFFDRKQQLDCGKKDEAFICGSSRHTNQYEIRQYNAMLLFGTKTVWNLKLGQEQSISQ